MRIFFLGICGAGMGNAALLLRELGHEVGGADSGIYPPMSTVLQQAGIEILDGYDVSAVIEWKPDRVVVGNALSRGNPVIEWLLDTRGLRYTSLPALLADLVLERRRSAVVGGTHGKTTTATLAAFLLREAGHEPGWLIGGVPLDLPSGAHSGGEGAPFVIEGDEYDSAFFDKRSKFIHYRPRYVTINNLEFDHADIFRDLADVQRSFRHLLRLVPAAGVVLINGDDPAIEELLPVPWTRVLRVGTGPSCDLQIRGFSETAQGSSFELHWQNQLWAEVNWQMGGLYNARNAAMAALLATHAAAAGDPLQFDLSALNRFRGIKRRREILWSDADTVVIEDFGHHPTAIHNTLESLRQRYPDYRLLACVEPRSNTARTRVLQNELIVALGAADAVTLGPIDRPEQMPEDTRLQIDHVCAALVASGCNATAIESYTHLENHLTSVLEQSGRQPLLLCFFSNGSFGGVMQALVGRLARSP